MEHDSTLTSSAGFLTHLGLLTDAGKDYVSAQQPAIDITKSPDGDTRQTALLLACSSDRGLCGAIHSSVSKLCRRLAAQDRGHTRIVVLGDKAKPQIARDSRRNIVMNFNQVGRNIPTFLDAVAIWREIQANGELQYDQVALAYNRFVSAISFDTVLVRLPTRAAISGAEKLHAYECETETISNLVSYLQLTRLYWALVEGHAAEMSSKRTAMENATKNAEAMVVALTMKYNRTRQAVITNELVDIIVGASAQQ